MKKIIFGLFLIFCMSSCSYLFADSDLSDSKNKTEELLKYLDEKNTSEISFLFSHNAKSNIADFNESIYEMIVYYDTSHKELLDFISNTTKSNDYGKKIKTYTLSTNVDTLKGVYRLSIKWCVEDDFDSNNVGIQSLYIIKLEDDIYPEYTYWGDGLWSNGINIGKVWSENQSE